MTDQEFNDQLKKLLSKISFENRRRFAFTITNRLMVDYQKFCIENEWGNFQLVQDCLNFCNTCDNKNQNHIDQLLNYKKQIAQHIPDTEDFPQIQTSYALNAGTAFEDTIDFIIKNDETKLLNISSYSTDTKDFKIQEEVTLTDQTNSKYLLMMQDEYQYQLNLAKELQTG